MDSTQSAAGPGRPGPDVTPPGARWGDLRRAPLDARGLSRALLAPDGPCAGFTVTERTASTNADLTGRAAELPDWTVLVTEHQEQGRGRLGRAWQTPARAALTFSVLLRPTQLPAAGWSWGTLLMGLAVTRVLRRVVGLDAATKWPNDVLVRPLPQGERLKVAGILAEFVPGAEPALVIGVGLNVSQTAEELPVPTATSLATAHAATTDRNVLLRAILREFKVVDDAWRAGGGDLAARGLLAQVRESCCTLGELVEVSLPGGRPPLEGTAEGIDESGRLLVRARGGLETVAAGDVVHVRPSVRRGGEDG